MTELRLYDNALHPDFCRQENRGKAVPNWNFQPDYIRVPLWSQDDYENYDHIWRERIPLEERILRPWDTLMDTARRVFLRSEAGIHHSWRRSYGHGRLNLKIKVREQIQNLFTPDLREFGMMHEIHIRKSHKEDTQRQIIAAIREICRRNEWDDIVIPTHALECESMAKDLIRKQYNDIEEVFEGGNAADIYEISQRYLTRSVPLPVDVPWGCFHFTSPLDTLIQVRDGAGMLLNKSLSDTTFHLSVAEAIDGKSIVITPYPGEHIGAPGLHVATLVNKTSLVANLTFGDGTTRELYGQTEVHSVHEDYHPGEDILITAEQIPVTIKTDWKSIAITEEGN